MESNKEEKIKTVSEENIYKLNGRVPLKKAIPFGLQHVLAMFVSNLAPVLIVCSAAVLRSNGAHLSSAEITQLLQCAMFVAGIGTCLQLYPIGVIGSGLPIIMGVSFTFLGSLLVIATNPNLGYEGMVGAVILGGIFEGFVGLSEYLGHTIPFQVLLILHLPESIVSSLCGNRFSISHLSYYCASPA